MKRFPKIVQSGQRESVLDESRILVAFKKATTLSDVRTIARELKLEVEDTSSSEGNKHWIQINHTSYRFWLRSPGGRSISEDEFSAIEKKLGNKVNWIGPVYRNEENAGLTNYFCPLPDVLLVRKSRAFANERERLRPETVKELGLELNERKSSSLTSWYYLQIVNAKKENAYELGKRLRETFGDIRYENMPMYKPLAATIPNDTLWANQWNMQQINAPNGWDISTGSNSVVICILDEGCDLTHPDLQFSEPGINLGTMAPDGSPTGSHGTACAGIAAGTFDNGAGVAGVAGNCLVMPVAFQNWTDVEVANGINYASTNGAGVISMSFGSNAWDPATIDPEISNAFANDVVMCVATHNYNAAITYPATNPLVMAVGGSDQNDNRKTASSPDGECWGADFGDINYGGVPTGVSVVAPCVLCPTTDIQGNQGYYDGSGPVNNWACMNYANPGPAGGDYILIFDGTSAATPHVAGLAALIRSQYPSLTNVQVRNIIERTAARVGTLAYAEKAGFPNGTRNQEMGYGRIDVFRALDFADVLIKDWAGDDGREPSTPPGGNFWDFSDIVTRINDDDVFNPSNPAQSKHVERGQTNYIYVKVTNNGAREARNVTVNIRITPYVGLQFVFPQDWTLVDGMHVNPTSILSTFASIPAGSGVIAKFSLSPAQVEELYGWQYDNPWHPCLLAQVTSDNDYAFASSDLSFGNLVLRKNNFAQRNLSVIDVLAGTAMAFSFIAGSKFKKQRSFTLRVDKSGLPEDAEVLLKLSGNEKAFPQVTFHPALTEDHRETIRFSEKTSFVTRMGCCDALLTLEKGSSVSIYCADSRKLKVRDIQGGEFLINSGEEEIRLRENRSAVRFDCQENSIYALSVKINFPENVKKDKLYKVVISQEGEGAQIEGGATAIYKIQ